MQRRCSSSPAAPRTSKPTLYKDADSAKFRELRAGSPIRFIIIHTIYLINLASENEDFYEKSVTSLAGALDGSRPARRQTPSSPTSALIEAPGFRRRPRARAAGLRRALAERGLARPPAAREHSRRRRHHGRGLRELGQIIDAAAAATRAWASAWTRRTSSSPAPTCARARESMGCSRAGRRLRPRPPRDVPPQRLRRRRSAPTATGAERRRRRPRRRRVPPAGQRSRRSRPARHPGGAGLDGQGPDQETWPGSARSSADAGSRPRRRHRQSIPASRVYSAAPHDRRATGTGGDAMEFVTVTTVSDAGVAERRRQSARAGRRRGRRRVQRPDVLPHAVGPPRSASSSRQDLFGRGTS